MLKIIAEKLLTRILLTKRKPYSPIVRINKKNYILSISEYESATESIKKWEKHLNK